MTQTLNPGLTVALITKNEAANLDACLESIAGLTDKIVIIDSGSTDATAEIAARYGAQFHTHADWPGFGPQRNRAHAYIDTEWVLWLDADERLTPELKQSIQTALANTAADGKHVFKFNRLSNAFGVFIRHCGWYPDWVIRLYPTAYARYSDDLVHEKVLLPAGAQIEKLHGDALHYTYATLEQFLAKQNGYSATWAKQKHAAGKTASIGQALLHSAGCFVKMYLLKAGFLDGKPGFLLSVLSAQAVFNKYAALWLENRK